MEPGSRLRLEECAETGWRFFVAEMTTYDRSQAGHKFRIPGMPAAIAALCCHLAAEQRNQEGGLPTESINSTWRNRLRHNTILLTRH